MCLSKIRKSIEVPGVLLKALRREKEAGSSHIASGIMSTALRYRSFRIVVLIWSA